MTIFYSVRNYSLAVYTHAMMRAMQNVHHARRRANRNVYVAVKYRSVIAVTWCGRVKRPVINYSNAEDIGAKSNAIAVTAVHARPDYYDRVHAEKR